MKLLRLSLLALAACAAATAADAPAKNWVLPLFTKEGFRSMTARGSEAGLSGPHQFEVIDLNLTLYSGDSTSTVETILLAPAATFLPDEKIARGEKSVRLIRDDLEATGTRWVCRQADKKISLDGGVRVIFHAALADILK